MRVYLSAWLSSDTRKQNCVTASLGPPYGFARKFGFERPLLQLRIGLRR